MNLPFLYKQHLLLITANHELECEDKSWMEVEESGYHAGSRSNATVGWRRKTDRQMPAPTYSNQPVGKRLTDHDRAVQLVAALQLAKCVSLSQLTPHRRDSKRAWKPPRERMSAVRTTCLSKLSPINNETINQR